MGPDGLPGRSDATAGLTHGLARLAESAVRARLRGSFLPVVGE